MDVAYKVFIELFITLIGPFPVIVRCKYCSVVDTVDAVSWTIGAWTKAIQTVKSTQAFACTITSMFV